MDDRRLRKNGVRIFLLLTLALTLVACGSAPRKDLELERLRSQLQDLRGEAEVIEYASAELEIAERAVRELAVSPSASEAARAHMAYLADRRIDIARARASERSEKQRLVNLQRDRDRMLLEASLLEAERARAEAERLRRQAIQRTEEAEQALAEAQTAREETLSAERERQLAEEEARQAQRLANAREREATLARQEAELAAAAADSLRRQLENLQARETNRGLMFTLGDVLFEYGEAELRQASLDNLARLVSFIQDYPERTISIEGHTDSRGSEGFNLELSQQRAEAVRDALVQRGVDGGRMQAVGLGEEFPVASNETDLGRRQNRRVEIIILNPDAS